MHFDEKRQRDITTNVTQGKTKPLTRWEDIASGLTRKSAEVPTTTLNIKAA